VRHAPGVGGDRRGCWGNYVGLGLEAFHIARKKVCVACFFGAGLAGKNFDERRFALHQVLQAGLHGAEIVEGMHTLAARAEFAGGLRAAQEQDAEDGNFVAVEVKGFLEAMLVLGDAAVRGADGTDERLTVEGMQRVADGGFLEIHDRFTVRFLVAGIEESVQGERVVLGSVGLLFDEGTENAAFDFVQKDIHGLK